MKPASISEEELLNLINKLNNDNNVDGLLVQLPLPGEIYIALFKMMSEARRGLFSLYNWLLMCICLKERGGKLKRVSMLLDMGPTYSEYQLLPDLVLRS